MDILKYNARNLINKKLKFCTETTKIWKMVDQSIKLYYDLFYDFNLETVNKLSKNRDAI